MTIDLYGDAGASWWLLASRRLSATPIETDLGLFRLTAESDSPPAGRWTRRAWQRTASRSHPIPS